MVVTMLKNRVIHVFYIQIKFIIKFTHLHVFIAQRNLLSGHTSYHQSGLSIALVEEPVKIKKQGLLFFAIK